jgi:hypothetical protein
MEWIWGTAVVLWLIVAFIVGVIVGRVGQWARLHQVEAKIRQLANEVHTNALYETDGRLPAEWMRDRLDWISGQDFR